MFNQRFEELKPQLGAGLALAECGVQGFQTELVCLTNDQLIEAYEHVLAGTELEVQILRELKFRCPHWNPNMFQKYKPA